MRAGETKLSSKTEAGSQAMPPQVELKSKGLEPGPRVCALG